MFYQTLPAYLKTKVLRGPKKILEKVIEKKKEDIDWLIDGGGYKLFRDVDKQYTLFYLKKEKEIIDEIKENVLKHLNKLNLSREDKLFIKTYLPKITTLDDLQIFECYFKFYEVYPRFTLLLKQSKKETTTINGQKTELPSPEEVKEIDILSVLDRLGIAYKKVGTSTYALYEDGKQTDGRRANTDLNIVNDFTEKNRPHGNPLHFVCMYLGIEPKEALLWFKDNFNI